MTNAGGRLAVVTGGAGFIGSHLADRLVAEGFRVRVLDDFSTGREGNLAGSRGRLELRRADVRDPAAVASAFEGADVVFHQAAVPSVPRSLAEPLFTDEVNAHGTLLVLESARRAGVRRVVYAASSSVYGETDELPKVETMCARPHSPYALQKYAGEVYCRQYTELFGLETVALRYFNVFGPRQDPDSEYAAVVPRFVRSYLQDEPPCIYGDGEQTRDFTYVEDAVRANLLAADAPRAAGAAVNVAGGRQTSMNELARLVRELTGRSCAPVHGPPRAGDVRHSMASLERAGQLLGYAPGVDLREGLRRTIESFDGAGRGERR